MGTIAARHAYQIIQNIHGMQLAIECITAMQGVEYRGIERMAPRTLRFFEKAREIVPSITKDRMFSTDIEACASWLKTYDFDELMQV